MHIRTNACCISVETSVKTTPSHVGIFTYSVTQGRPTDTTTHLYLLWQSSQGTPESNCFFGVNTGMECFHTGLDHRCSTFNQPFPFDFCEWSFGVCCGSSTSRILRFSWYLNWNISNMRSKFTKHCLVTLSSTLTRRSLVVCRNMKLKKLTQRLPQAIWGTAPCLCTPSLQRLPVGSSYSFWKIRTAWSFCFWCKLLYNDK